MTPSLARFAPIVREVSPGVWLAHDRLILVLLTAHPCLCDAGYLQFKREPVLKGVA